MSDLRGRIKIYKKLKKYQSLRSLRNLKNLNERVRKESKKEKSHTEKVAKTFFFCFLKLIYLHPGLELFFYIKLDFKI